MNNLKAKHPNFRGNWKDLEQFEMLAQSPVRSPQREKALKEWEDYKRARQYGRVRGPIKKGGHMRALISRTIDLTGANLDEICIGYADFRGVIFDYCSMRSAWLKGSNFENASLRSVDFTAAGANGRGPGRLLYAFLPGADLTGANCSGVDFSFASLNSAKLRRTDLTGADLSHVSLVRADLEGAILRSARVYGIAVWDIVGTPKAQEDLIISLDGSLGDKGAYYLLKDRRAKAAKSGDTAELEKCETSRGVTVDRLELAQFVNLLMRNGSLRDVIGTIGERGVLILGRFTEERKRVLDLIRVRLRELGYVPMLFDFEKPTRRDFTETVKTLAGLSRFIVADITRPRSTPLELQATMPDFMIPFVPIIQEREKPFAMFQDLQAKYGEWVLDLLRYDTAENLAAAFEKKVVAPAMALSERLSARKREKIRTRHVLDL